MKLKINGSDAKKFTIFLITGRVCITSSPAHAASIIFDSFTLGKPVIKTTLGAGGGAGGSGSSQPNTLKASAEASFNPSHPIASLPTLNATTTISESSFFTVVAGAGEKQGSTVEGELYGSLAGILAAPFGVDANITGGYTASVDANVNAGFASYNSPSSSATSISGSFGLAGSTNQPVFYLSMFLEPSP